MGRSYRTHTGLAKSVFNFSFLRLVSSSQKKRFTMGRGCLTGDSAHYLLKNHSFYRPIVFWPCLFTDRPLSLPSPLAGKLYSVERDWLQRLPPRGENVVRGHNRVSRVQRRETTTWKGLREILSARDGCLTSVCTRLNLLRWTSRAVCPEIAIFSQF